MLKCYSLPDPEESQPNKRNIYIKYNFTVMHFYINNVFSASNKQKCFVIIKDAKL